METGRLYIVATPIGNLGDIGQRAIEVLATVALVAAEDTRHSRRLFEHYGINTKLMSLHEHNETKVSHRVLEALLAGEDVALISDAGTPLISDPGFPLVRLCREQGVQVSPVPGPSALIAALSASGLPANQFCFHGFLPRTSVARLTLLKPLLKQSVTQIFYESSHRILATLEDLQTVLVEQRQLVVGRELTKIHEDFITGDIDEVVRQVKADGNRKKGEFVLIIAGAEQSTELTTEQQKMLEVLVDELPVKQAAAITARITGLKKNQLYKIACELKTG